MKTELTPELNWPEERYRLQWILFDRGYLLGDAEVSGWLWSHDRVVHVLGAEPEGLMLGSWFGQPVAVAEVDEASIKAASIKATRRVALRSALLASPMQQALLARAAQVLRFDRDHRFCSRCGRQLEMLLHELARRCQDCQLDYYPRIHPCVIMLVTQGPLMLLAEGVRFAQPILSCLAGFVEAGETAETAVHREVFEESGLEIANLCYVASQAWPFPHSLMLGFLAEYERGILNPDPAELVRAQWVHPGERHRVAPEGTLARLLIDQHCQRVLGHGYFTQED